MKPFPVTCEGKCCWKGPSRVILDSGGRATEVGWSEKHATVEECSKRCEEVADCQAFHYYGVKDGHKTDCYLHKKGYISSQQPDGRDRFAGVCKP